MSTTQAAKTVKTEGDVILRKRIWALTRETWIIVTALPERPPGVAMRFELQYESDDGTQRVGLSHEDAHALIAINDSRAAAMKGND